MLATDYMLQAAIGLLESIRDGKLRLDRTIEVSVINLREKRRLSEAAAAQPATLDNLLRRNRERLPAWPSARASRGKQRRAGMAAAGRAGAAGPCG